MKYLLPCGQCGEQHPVEPSQAGGQISCTCGETIEVPSLRGLRDLETAADSTANPASGQDPKSGRSREIAGRLTCVIGLFVFALGLATAAFGGLVYVRIDVPPPLVDQPEAAAAIIDDMDAGESLELWMDFREHGLGYYQLPQDQAIAQVAEHYWRVMCVGIGLIVVGLLASTIPLLLSRRAG